MRMAALALTTCLLANASAALEIRLGTAASVVSGLEPSTQVTWLWVDRRLDDYAAIITHGTEITPDSDGDGKVELEVPAGISPLSVWVAVDLATGTVATASPEGFKPPPITAPDAPELLAPAPADTHLQALAGIVRALVVRPGSGAWQTLAGDGTALDIDLEQDGTITLDLAQLEPIADSPAPPETFAAGDVVVFIDAETLGFFQATVTDPPAERGP